MNRLESTCGKCPKLRFGAIMGTLKTAFCGFNNNKNGPIVPHQSELENGKRGDNTKMVLTRIPMSCPRVDVKKSEKSAPASEWVKLIITPEQGKV